MMVDVAMKPQCSSVDALMLGDAKEEDLTPFRVLILALAETRSHARETLTTVRDGYAVAKGLHERLEIHWILP
jgi:hypothetical protein